MSDQSDINVGTVREFDYDVPHAADSSNKEDLKRHGSRTETPSPCVLA